MTAAPSMRMVVSLADLDESRWVNLTGVSGHAFDRHYVDQTDLWVDGETLPWRLARRSRTPPGHADAEPERRTLTASAARGRAG